MNNMQQKEAGILNILLIPVIILSVLVAGLGVFGAWSYTKYQDYKNNVDKKIAAAVTDAKVKQQKELEAAFAEREKQPTRKFSGPEQLGSVGVTYPKTWSVYIDRDGIASTNNFEAYFNPGVVKPVSGKNPDALRISIQQKDYARTLQGYANEIKKGELKAAPIKLQSGEGTRLDGKFDKEIEGAMIIFALRDKTVQIYTESKEFIPDFDKIVLPTLTFIP